MLRRTNYKQKRREGEEEKQKRREGEEEKQNIAALHKNIVP